MTFAEWYKNFKDTHDGKAPSQAELNKAVSDGVITSLGTAEPVSQAPAVEPPVVAASQAPVIPLDQQVPVAPPVNSQTDQPVVQFPIPDNPPAPKAPEGYELVPVKPPNKSETSVWSWVRMIFLASLMGVVTGLFVLSLIRR
jgi:hypothetical protein